MSNVLTSPAVNPSTLSQQNMTTTAKQFEESTQINASVDKVFALYADVANWPAWDPDLKAASLQGKFVSGAVGEVVPHSGPKSALHFVEVARNQHVRMQCKLPLGVMHFDYELQPQADGKSTRVIHRTRFSGLLSPLWFRLIGSGMKKSLPAALAGLKRQAEA